MIEKIKAEYVKSFIYPEVTWSTSSAPELPGWALLRITNLKTGKVMFERAFSVEGWKAIDEAMRYSLERELT